MVSIRFTETKTKGKCPTLTLTLEGHAGQADIGHDIVCSSVSILTYTVAQIVKNIHDKGGLKKKPILIIEEGKAKIECVPKESSYGTAAQAFLFAQTGYHLLAHNYPQFVDLKMFGEG